jgi:CDP-diacylglycerol--glycerol-3-phosphate 3-phosphatidyltransferase
MGLINTPTFLTLFRLIFSPLILPVLFAYLLPHNLLWLNILLSVIFILVSMTDFFDGYLARKYNQETVLGRVLDPIADKFLVYSALIGLLVAHKIFFYWVIILIGREFFVMAIRHVALEHNFSVPVSKMAKLKTMIQLITIAVIIVNPYQHISGLSIYWNNVEYALLIVTMVLSLITAQQYYDAFIRQLHEKIKIKNNIPEIDEYAR